MKTVTPLLCKTSHRLKPTNLLFKSKRVPRNTYYKSIQTLLCTYVYQLA